jgi:phytoene desaturase
VQHYQRPLGHEAMREEIAQARGSVDATALTRSSVGCGGVYLIEMPNFINRNFDSPLGLLSLA